MSVVTVKPFPRHSTPFVLLVIAAALILSPSYALSETADYFYDPLGRLQRVVDGSMGVAYQYDELGNILSVSSSAITQGSPQITSISHELLFVDSLAQVTIYGQNLFTTESVTANGGLIDIEVISISETQIVANMTALAAGSEIITVTTNYGSPNTDEATIDLTDSKLSFTPGQMTLEPLCFASAGNGELPLLS